MRGHQRRRVAGPLRLRHQLVGAAAVLPQIALDRVEQRDRPEDGEQLRRVAELLAQLAGASEDRLDLRARPSLHHPERQPADHLESQLVLQALGALRHAAQHREPALGERQRLAKREQADGVPRAGEEVLARSGRNPGPIRRARRAGRRSRRAHQGGAPRASARRGRSSAARRVGWSVRVQRVLVEHVDELILERQRQVRELVLPGALDEHVHVLERVEPFLDFGRVHLESLRRRRRSRTRAPARSPRPGASGPPRRAARSSWRSCCGSRPAARGTHRASGRVSTHAPSRSTRLPESRR